MSVSENSAARTCNDFPHLNRMKFRALIDRITVIHSYGMSLIVDTEGASCDVATCINAVSCDRNCRYPSVIAQATRRRADSHCDECAIRTLEGALTQPVPRKLIFR